MLQVDTHALEWLKMEPCLPTRGGLLVKDFRLLHAEQHGAARESAISLLHLTGMHLLHTNNKDDNGNHQSVIWAAPKLSRTCKPSACVAACDESMSR